MSAENSPEHSQLIEFDVALPENLTLGSDIIIQLLDRYSHVCVEYWTYINRPAQVHFGLGDAVSSIQSDAAHVASVEELGKVLEIIGLQPQAQEIYNRIGVEFKR